MHPISKSLSVIALLLAIAAVPLWAQDWVGRGRLQGVVVNEEGKPVEGAKVILRPADTPLEETVDDPEAGPPPIFTNPKGRWSYLGLRSGSWKVLISAEGYVDSEGQVRVNEFAAGQETLRVRLRRIPKEVLEQAKASEALKRLEQGNLYLQEGRLAEARAEYEAALAELEPENHPPILLGIARTHFQEGNTEQAVATLEQALALDPGNVEALKLISNLLIAAGREEEARPYIARLPEGEKLDPDALLNVGIELYNRGDLDGALEEFDRVVRDYPELPEAYYYRGLVLLGQEKHDLARADFEKLLELDPENQHAAEAKEFLKYLEPGT